MFCSKCGLQAHPEDRFCEGCGAPLNKEILLRNRIAKSKVIILAGISTIVLAIITYKILNQKSSSKQDSPQKIAVNLTDNPPESPPPIRSRVISEQPIRLNSDKRPRKIKDIKPAYPQEALDARIQGVVIIEAIADFKGHVSQARVISGHPLLNDAALNAIKQWEYEPYILYGIPKSYVFTAIFTFSLQNE